jgi:hypothetical protein
VKKKRCLHWEIFPPFLAPTPPAQFARRASVCTLEEKQVAYPSQRQAFPFLLLLRVLRELANKAARRVQKTGSRFGLGQTQNLYEIKRGGKGFRLFSAHLAVAAFFCALQI